MLPYPSHYNACNGLRQYLEQEGYRTVATITPNLQVHAQGLGFETLPLRYVQESHIKSPKVWLAVLLSSWLNPLFVKKRYRSFLEEAHAIDHIVEQQRPHCIYIDAHLGYYYVFLKRFGVPVELVQTKLSVRQYDGIPPMTCDTVFKDSLLYRCWANLLWWKYQASKRIKGLLTKAAYLGKDDAYFLERIAHQNKLDPEKLFNYAHISYLGMNEVSTQILCPNILEYPWKKPLPQERHIWYNTGENKRSAWAFWEELKVVKQNYRIVFCSLGTLETIDFQAAIGFLRRMIEAHQNLPDVFLIISAGTLAQTLKGNSPTLRIYERVPQKELLPHCDLMITHGGLNSIKECILAEVPMLVYPLNLKIDQPGNAARVVYYGLGLKGNLRNETPQLLKAKIENLLNNSAYRTKLTQMKTLFISHAVTKSSDKSIIIQVPEQKKRKNDIEVVLINWKRPKNVEKIVESLRNQTIPITITICDCNPSKEFELSEKTRSVIDRLFSWKHNLGGFNRFVPMPSYEHKYTFFLDDDLLPGRKCLEFFLNEAEKIEDFGVLGQIGRMVDDDLVYRPKSVKRNNELQDVDFIVRAYFTKTKHLHNVVKFRWELGYFEEELIEDDLLLCASLKFYEQLPSYLLPYNRDIESLINYDELSPDFALSERSNHYLKRNDFIRRLIKAGWKPLKTSLGYS